MSAIRCGDPIFADARDDRHVTSHVLRGLLQSAVQLGRPLTYYSNLEVPKSRSSDAPLTLLHLCRKDDDGKNFSFSVSLTNAGSFAY